MVRRGWLWQCLAGRGVVGSGNSRHGMHFGKLRQGGPRYGELRLGEFRRGLKGWINFRPYLFSSIYNRKGFDYLWQLKIEMKRKSVMVLKI